MRILTAQHTPFRIGSLGLTADRVRRLKSGAQYESLFPGTIGTDPFVTQNAEVHDTLRFIKKVVMDTLGDTRKLAAKLQRNSTPATLKAIFDFFYQHYQYKLDAYGVEQVRRPARAWADRKEGIDCDCFSCSVSSVLVNLGIDHYLKIIGINGRDYFQHVYVVIPKFKGADINVRDQYWVIDPVLNSFDEEAPNITKKDHLKMNGIPLQYLNGIGGTTGGLGSEFDYLNQERVDGLGFLIAQNHYPRFRAAMHQHVRNTMNKVASNPASVEAVYQPQPLLGMLGELDRAFAGSDDHLFNTLERLGMAEDSVLQPMLQGMDVNMSDGHLYDAMMGDVDDQMIGTVMGNLGRGGRAARQARRAERRASAGNGGGGRHGHGFRRHGRHAAPADDGGAADAPEAAEATEGATEGLGRKGGRKKKKRSGFFTKVKNGLKKVKNSKAFKLVKKVAHVVRKVNPLAAAARGGFLLALRTNFGHMAEKAYWGYKTYEEAAKAGVSKEYWDKAVELVKKITKVLVDRLGSEEKFVRKAILNGRAAKKIAKALKGMGFLGSMLEISGLTGLGSATATAAGVTAALSFITPILTWISKNFKGKKGMDTKGGRGSESDDAVENENGTTSEAPTSDAVTEMNETTAQANNPDNTIVANDRSVEDAAKANDEPLDDGDEKKKRMINPGRQTAPGSDTASSTDKGGDDKGADGGSAGDNADAGDNGGDDKGADKSKKKGGNGGAIVVGVLFLAAAGAAAMKMKASKDKEKKPAHLSGLPGAGQRAVKTINLK